MAITLGTELGLGLHVDYLLTYTAVEKALTDAGFTNYTFMRTQNSDGSTDFQVYVRNDDVSEPLDAVVVLTDLAEAFGDLAEAPTS